ncbi:hypothetical protein LXL04_023815 [Taraxacum kok-saghyz]
MGYPRNAPATVLFGEWFRFEKSSDQYPHNDALTTYFRSMSSSEVLLKCPTRDPREQPPRKNKHMSNVHNFKTTQKSPDTEKELPSPEIPKLPSTVRIWQIPQQPHIPIQTNYQAHPVHLQPFSDQRQQQVSQAAPNSDNFPKMPFVAVFPNKTDPSNMLEALTQGAL